MSKKQIISLGFFCGIAEELERLGLRNKSYPFDWLITPWESVELLIDTNFRDFLNPNLLSQRIENRGIYINTKLKCKFFHDFDEYNTLEKQLYNVQLKYNRRINNFFEDIKSPTIFIRYIANEEELITIEKKYLEILDMFKTFNIDNEIIFIANNSFHSKLIPLSKVTPNENDSVARAPLMQLDTMEQQLQIFLGTDVISDNLKFTFDKQKNPNNLLTKINNKRKQYFKKSYIHSTEHSVDSEINIP